MTIQEAIDRLDSVHHNTYTDHDKLCWLSTLDHQIKTEIFDCCAGGGEPFAGYGDRTGRDTVLLAAAPYDAMYPHYLQAQMHYHNAEFDRCNNAMAMFQTVFNDFQRHYNRTHRPKSGALRYF